MGYKDLMLELFGENLVFLEGKLTCTLRPGLVLEYTTVTYLSVYNIHDIVHKYCICFA